MLTESMEDYLEMICRLVESKGYVRAIDLSDNLNVQSSSVTRMIQKLDETGYIAYEKYRNIALTPLGRKYGRFLMWRDATLKEFLTTLNAQADIDAQVEGIEHYITPKTMVLIRNLVRFFHTHPDSLAELHQPVHVEYPDGEDLQALRAWEFKHTLE